MIQAEEVFALIRAAISTVLEIPETAVHRESRFREDLRADSLAIVEVVEILEERLAGRVPAGFYIDDADLDSLTTVGEATDYVVARL